jgi:protein-S-isoprenylcysteine O-methyltransferase Ste14
MMLLLRRTLVRSNHYSAITNALKLPLMTIKIYREEKFLKEAFGEKYQLYSFKVKRLIPFIF